VCKRARSRGEDAEGSSFERGGGGIARCCVVERLVGWLVLMAA
jgi:hypothetical protein